MSDLEDKIRRSQRKKQNRVHELTSRIIEHEAARRKAKDAGNSDRPPARLRPFYQGNDHPSEGWKREYTPRSSYRLSSNGTVQFEDVNLNFDCWSDTYAKLARLPSAALDALVEYDILKINNPSSSRYFNKRERRTGIRMGWINGSNEHGTFRWGPIEVEVRTSFSLSKYDISDSFSNSSHYVPLQAEQCRELYDICKDDERALEALQDLGIIKDTVIRIQMDKVALFCGLDGEEIPHAYAAMYENPTNRTYAQKSIFGKRDRRRKKRD